MFLLLNFTASIFFALPCEKQPCCLDTHFLRISQLSLSGFLQWKIHGFPLKKLTKVLTTTVIGTWKWSIVFKIVKNGTCLFELPVTSTQKHADFQIRIYQ